MILNGCNVSNNISAGVGGGIYNHDGTNQSKLYVYNSTISGNSNLGNGGGGIYTREGSYLLVVNSTFFKNVSGSGGGLTVYATGARATSADIISSTFYDNVADTGSGIKTVTNSTVKIYNSIISGNKVVNDLIAANTVAFSNVILGELVFDNTGGVISGQTFNPETMISSTPVNGTFMITEDSPAAKLGMSSSLLQALGNSFTPPIANDIITKDQLGNSRVGNTAMGAVTVKITPATTVKADMLDVIFNIDGTATDVSPMQHTVTVIKDDDAPMTVALNTTYGRNVVTFNPVENGKSPGAGKGSCYSVDYQNNVAFQTKLADGHSFETLVKFDVDYTSSQNYETKFFSTHQAGGTGFLVANSPHASGDNGLTFLPNVSETDGGGSRWIWGNSQIKPNGSSWYHLVGVWDKAAGKAYLYVNGEKKAEVDAAGFYRPAALNPLWLTIGADPGNENEVQNPFKGSLTIARIYDKALTEAEAVALWNAAR